MGSVKDLVVIEHPEERRMGRGRFIFTDDYSVRDFGKMPDKIPYKGKALCLTAAYFFEKASERGIPSHYNGVVSRDGRLVSVDELDEPTNVMDVNLVRVFKPEFRNGEYDYSVFKQDMANFVIPLEFIYRNRLPQGSSVFRRLKKGELTYQDLGLDHEPKEGEKLQLPFIEASTKFEETDRYFRNWIEALTLIELRPFEDEDIYHFMEDVNDVVTEMAKKAGLENEDGKGELAFNPYRGLMHVDVNGTLDECRFTLESTHVSKEVARNYYDQTPWAEQVQAAKDRAKAEKVKNWRQFSPEPPRLDPDLRIIISRMYMSAANAFLGKELFDSPPLERVVRDYKQWRESIKHPD